MIPTGHLLVGGAVGVTLSSLGVDPAVATPLALVGGVASHHVLDWIPHTDAGTFYPDDRARQLPASALAIIVAEGLLGLALTVFLFLAHYPTWPFIAGAIGGMLPDLLDNIPLWQRKFRQTRLGAAFHRFHHDWHCGDMTRAWVAGIAVDVLVVCGGLWYLLA